MAATASYDAQDLPDYLAIMVVDSKGFSRHDDLQQNVLASLIPEVLAGAADRAGIPELWSDRLFPDSTGDGYLFGFPTRLLTRVVNRYLECLQLELRSANAQLASGTLRLRLSLNLGPVEVLNESYLDSPVGQTMIDTHRLVDCQELRTLLDCSDARVTFLAAALSEPVMDAAVRRGYSGRFDSEFVATPVAIDAKDFRGTAYLQVPTLSGDLLRYGLLGVQPTAIA